MPTLVNGFQHVVTNSNNMDTKYPGQKTSPVGNPPTGMWYDPSVKESAAQNSVAEALRYFIKNNSIIGLPTHVSASKRMVYFDTGKSLSFDDVVKAYVDNTTQKDSGFMDGPVDLGKDPEGDFPSVTWMPRGQEDKDVADADLTAARGVPGSVFTVENAQAVLDQIKSSVKAPYVNGTVSTLGGDQHVSIMLTISLDPKESWVNGIIENSNYGKFHIDNDGTIEMHSGSLKFRKASSNSVEDLIAKLNRGITPKPVAPTSSLVVKAEISLDPTTLRKAIELYVNENKYDIDWFEQYGEKYVDYLRSEAWEEAGRRLSDNVISRILEEMDADQWYDVFGESEVDSWISNLEGIDTEEALAETYPQILDAYKKVKPKIQMNYTSALEEVPEDYKQQIAAKYGVEYISALQRYEEATNNGHDKERAMKYAIAELKKQDIIIEPIVLSQVIETYAK